MTAPRFGGERPSAAATLRLGAIIVALLERTFQNGNVSRSTFTGSAVGAPARSWRRPARGTGDGAVSHDQRRQDAAAAHGARTALEMVMRTLGEPDHAIQHAVALGQSDACHRIDGTLAAPAEPAVP